MEVTETKVRLGESSIPSELMNAVNVDLKYDWDPADTEPIYMCLFTAIAKTPSFFKSKEDGGKRAFEVVDYKGNFLLGAYVVYTPGSTEAMPGNWSFAFTFDRDDIKDIPKIINNHENSFQKILGDVVLELLSWRYCNTNFQDGLTLVLIQTLVNCLDTNAAEGAKFIITLPEVFDAISTIEDGEKVFAIEPSARLSRIVKGDGEIQA